MANEKNFPAGKFLLHWQKKKNKTQIFPSFFIVQRGCCRKWIHDTHIDTLD